MVKTLVVGLGISGKGAVKFLESLGEEVQGVDSILEVDPFDFDQVVISPGVPLDHPLCHKAREKGIPILGEAELAARHLRQRCIGVTGTNGKTTAVEKITHVLREVGHKARAVGNIGVSLCEYLTRFDPEDVLVIELSSFQLETLATPFLDVALLLNISPDHLDRHGTFEAYRAAKLRIFDLLKSDKKIAIFPESEYEVWQALKEFNVTPESAEKALLTFKRPPHRLEFVRDLEGVRYVNDSKATNVAAVLHALREIKGNVHLIAGGSDKGLSYTEWVSPFQGKVKKVYAIGESVKTLERDLQGSVDIDICHTLNQALQAAKRMAKEGEVILLSPGCASFDQFESYVQRGEEFKRLVEKL